MTDARNATMQVAISCSPDEPDQNMTPSTATYTPSRNMTASTPKLHDCSLGKYFITSSGSEFYPNGFSVKSSHHHGHHTSRKQLRRWRR